MQTTTAVEPGANVPGLRWRFPFVLLLSVIVAYMDRMKISYALPKIAADYGWTVAQTGKYGGLLMSIFFIGYGLSNVFLSPVAEKYGPRKSLLFIIAGFSLICMIQTPLALLFTALVATRFCLGIAEGAHFPMLNSLTKNWFPPFERSRANAIWLCGIQGSMIIAPLVVVPIINLFTWQGMFVVLGLMGLLLVLPLFWLMVFDTPQDHPKISKEEIEFIQNNLEADLPEKAGFREGIGFFLKEKRYWLCVAASTLNNIGAFGTLTWLPTYFTEERGLPFSSLTWAVSIPFVFAVLGLVVWAFLGDKTNRRSLIAAAGTFLSGFAIYFATWVDSVSGAVAFFSLSVFLQASYTAGGFVVVQRILPKNRVATGVGLFNGLAMMVGGALGPVVVGGMVSATGNYTMGILSMMAVAFMTGAVLLYLSRILKY